jgi:ketosteroid isomerase-like protein
MDREGAARWLEGYVDAWRTYDRDRIGELFAEDAEYRYHPYDAEPVRGRDAIVDHWVAHADEPGTYQGSYRPIAVEGDTVVATGTSTYFDGKGAIREVFDNCFVIRFDPDGKAREFVEWYMKRPG